VSSARVFGITFWVVLHKHSAYIFRSAYSVFYSAFMFAAFKAISLLFCAGFFFSVFCSSHCIASASRLPRRFGSTSCVTQRKAHILQVFNGCEPYDHVVQNIIIEFFWPWVEEAGHYDFHVRMLSMDNRGILGYFWLILLDGMGSMVLD